MDSDSNSRSYKNSRRRSATKRVSFSIIEGGITFDEIAKMRQMKEKELDNFIAKKTNLLQLMGIVGCHYYFSHYLSLNSKL